MFAWHMQYWSRKLLGLCGLTLAVFALPHLLPGASTAHYASWPLTPQEEARLAAAYGFDRPFPHQYVQWLRRIATGQWGTSRYYNRPVFQDAVHAMVLTGTLLLWTMLATTVWLVIIWNIRRRFASPPASTYAPRLIAFALALPNFLVAIIVRDVFVWQFGWISMANLPLFDPYYLMNPPYMLLPASALALMPLLLWHGYGLFTPHPAHKPGARQVIARCCEVLHPVLAAFLLEIVLTEYALALPGLGKLGITALKRRDLPVLQAFFLGIGVLYFILHLALDWGSRLRRQSPVSSPQPAPPLPPLLASRRGRYEGIVSFGVLLALALLAPAFVLHDPAEIHSADQFLQPGYRYLFGTDFLGRDIFSRTLEGFRNAIPLVILITLCTGGCSFIVLKLGHLLPPFARRFGQYGVDLLAAIPPFVLAFMAFIVIEHHAWALGIALTLACLPVASRLMATQAPLVYRAARLAQLGEFILLLCMIFSFLNIVTESFASTWGGDIRLGMNYSHLNMWVLLTPVLAVVWSRYSFLALSANLVTLTSCRNRSASEVWLSTAATQASPRQAASPY